MIKRSENNSNSLFIAFFNLLAILLLFAACTNSSQTSNNHNEKQLPYLGFKKIIEGDTIYHSIPEWKYVTADSLTLSSSDIKNKIWIVDFIFSSCQNICSPMTFAMKKVNDSLKEYTNEIEFLTFSIDPKHDTPSVLREYKKSHGINAENWHFLTGGEQKEINQFAIKQFLVFAAADKDAPGGFAHSQNFILIDQNKNVRGIFDGLSEIGRNDLINAAHQLMR